MNACGRLDESTESRVFVVEAKLNCRSYGSAIFRQVFCPRIISMQTGKSEATRPSRVCEPVQLDGIPVVLHCRLASLLSAGYTLRWHHTIRGAAVLRASGRESIRRADDVAFALFADPLRSRRSSCTE